MFLQNLLELFNEFNKHLIEDKKPSEYFNVEVKKDYFNKTYPLTMLSDLIKIDQSIEHHPEGNVWNHTMLVLDLAAEKKEKSKEPNVFMWAALLHDLGKALTTKVRKGKITAYDHDIVGEELAFKFLQEFNENDEFIYKVSKLVRWHMQVLFVVKDLPFAQIDMMISEVDINEVALLSLCDRLGRGNMNYEREKKENKNIEIFIDKCRIAKRNLKKTYNI